MNKRNRKRHNKRKSRLIHKIRQQQIIPAPNTSNLFWTLDELKALCRKKNIPLPPLLPHPRVSTQQQADKGYLESQEWRLLHEIAAYGFPVVRDENGEQIIIPEIHRGNSDRVELEMIAVLAKSYHAIPVAESLDRWMRPKSFHPIYNPDAKLTVEDTMNFLERIQLYPFAIVIKSDVKFDVIKEIQKTIGLIIGGQHGGRPKRDEIPDKLSKSDLKSKYRKTAQKLNQDGLSLGLIAKILFLPKSTIQGWLK